MKVLMVTNKVRTYALGFQNVIIPLQEMGHTVIWAADFSYFIGAKEEIPCITEQIEINTNPFKLCNILAYQQLKDIIKKHKIDAVYCSTPIGGVLARCAAKKQKIFPVIYAAHGFLFFKGAPLLNRTLYKWVEFMLAHWTDVLITINKEDYEAARKFKLRSKRSPYLVHGAGVNVGISIDVDKNRKRIELGIPQDAFVIVSASELNKNKNIKVVIEAISQLEDKNVFYAICGAGEEENALRKIADKLNLSKNILFLGYRTDVLEIMSCADVFVMSSFREGIPRALLEAMDLGLPCVGSRTRGLTDLIEDGVSGYLCNPKKPSEFAQAFKYILEHSEKQKLMGDINKKRVKQYSKQVVQNELLSIYQSVLI